MSFPPSTICLPTRLFLSTALTFACERVTFAVVYKPLSHRLGNSKSRYRALRQSDNDIITIKITRHAL